MKDLDDHEGRHWWKWDLMRQDEVLKARERADRIAAKYHDNLKELNRLKEEHSRCLNTLDP